MFLRICLIWFFFFKQKTAYEMRISDWSSDVCSSDLQSDSAKSDDVAAAPPGKQCVMQVIGDGNEIAAPDPRAEYLSVARVDQHLAQIVWCGAAPGLDAHDTVGTGGRQVNTQHRP